MDSPLTWQRIHWQRPLDIAGPLAAMRVWAADQRSPRLVLEARASAGQVQYLLGCPPVARSTVSQQLRTAVGGSRLTTDDVKRQAVSSALSLRLSTRHRALQTADIAATCRQLLGALALADADEVLVLQLLLGPRRIPLAIPDHSPSSIVMPWYQAAWIGNGGQVDGEKRSALRDKVSQHGFAAAIRLGVRAKSPGRQRRLLHALYAALRTSEAPGLRARIVSDRSRNLNRALEPWRWPLRLNVSEVVACTAWPIGEDDLPGLEPLHPRQVAPTALAKPGERIIGRALAPGVSGDIGYSVTDALRHAWIIGPTGTGKSTLLLNLIVQDLQAGRPVVVIEPNDLIHDLLARIPAERRDDVVLLDPTDDQPVGLNPLIARDRRPEVVADGLFSLFHNLYGDGLGPRSSDVLANCLNVLAERGDASLVTLPLLLTNAGFRRSLTQAVIRRDPIAAGPFWDWFDNLSPDARSQVIAPLSNKLRPLLRPALRGILGQRSPRFDIRDVLRHNKILLVPLQPGLIGPDTARLLAALVLNELWLAVRERRGLPAAQRTPVMVYLDEVQDYLRLPLDLADALATSRSLAVAWHLAHQYRDQLSPSMRAAFEANARSRICFQLTARDAREMAAGQQLISADDFTALPAYHAYASLVRGNARQPWASVVTRPAGKPTSQPSTIRGRSRSRYGQPLSSVEADFAVLAGQDHAAPTSGRRPRTSS